jgi:hypothetical protein
MHCTVETRRVQRRDKLSLGMCLVTTEPHERPAASFTVKEAVFGGRSRRTMGSKNLSVLSPEATPTNATRSIEQTEGFSGRVMDRVRQMFCGLHGHDNMLQFAHEHMFLQCTSCGYQTPGWRLNDLAAARPIQKAASSRTLVKTQPDSVRRVA